MSNDSETANKFLGQYFDYIDNIELPNEEQEIVQNCMEYVDDRFSRMKYILGLALDFTILAQRLSLLDDWLETFRPDISLSDIYNRYELVTKRGGRKANTLTFEYSGSQEGIRRIEEDVANFFHSLDRSGYPSAYVYNTGQWQKYTDLLLDCFILSEKGRLTLCHNLIDYGLTKLPKNRFYVRDTPRIRIYEEMIQIYPRNAPKENGGLTFQAMVFGYLSADRPHLNLVADKVRTGSSRQKRFGDIDCYLGLDLEASIEVKDFLLSENNFEKELGEFCRKVRGNQVSGIAVVSDVSAPCRELIESHCVNVLTTHDLLRLVTYWDWAKQNAALQGVLHFIAHIEQNPTAVRRLLAFIQNLDSTHDALTYYSGRDGMSIENP